MLAFSAASQDFGTVATGSAAEQTLTLSNSGEGSATAIAASPLAAPFAFKGDLFPGTGGDCADTLGASASCTLVVVFSPAAAGPVSAELSLGYQSAAGAATATIALSGTGSSPALLDISDGATFDFLFHAVGSSTDHTFTLTNRGEVEATAIDAAALMAPFSFKGGSFPGTGGSCGQSLAAAASCTVVVSYAPIATGNSTGTLSVGYSDGTTRKTATRSMTGTAFVPALLTLSDGPTFDFGTRAIGSTTEHSFTLNNTGGVSATALAATTGLAPPFAFKGGGYPGTGGSCSATLPVGSSCTVVLTFSPTVQGASAASLGISYSDGAVTQTVRRNLAGNGTAQGFLDISDAPAFDFGTRATGTSINHTFTVTNSGPVAATAIVGGALSPPFDYAGGSYPGTGGNCGTTLAQQGSCLVVVSFNPTTAGPASGTLTLTFFDGATTRTTSRPMTGTGTDLARLSISDDPGFDFGILAVGGSAEHSFTITNQGKSGATSISALPLAAPFSFKGGSYPGTGGTCAQTLAAFASCSIIVTFSPGAAGPYSGSLSLGYSDGIASQSAFRSILGQAAAAANLTISNGPVFDFGVRAVGSTTSQTFTVGNGGGFAATSLAAGSFTPPFSYLGGAYPGSGGTCASALAPASSCTIVLTFTPTAAGAASATLSLSYDDGVTARTATRPLTAQGASPASLALSDGPSFGFGTLAIGSSTDHTITVSNSGQVGATGLSATGLFPPFAFKGGSYPGSGGTCGNSLAAAATCSLVLTVAPVAQGASSATLVLPYFDGASNQSVAETLSATGGAPAALSLASHSFPPAASGSTQDHTFTVANSGAVSATGLAPGPLTAPFSFKGGSYPGAGGTCATTLAAGASCTLVVSFAPTATGASSTTVSLGYSNGASSQLASATLDGTAALPASLSLSGFDFGTVARGSTTPHSFTVTNSGGFGASAMSAVALSPPFSFSGGYPGTGGTCGATLAAAGSCTLVVTYAPAILGAASDSLVLDYYDGAASRSATGALSGVSASPALIAFAGFDFGTRANGSSTDQTLTISNSGAVPATSVLAGALSAPFSYKGGAFPGTGGSCASTLAAASSCTVVVSFAPAASGGAIAQLSLGYHDGAAVQSASATLSGAGAAPALLSAGGHGYGVHPIGSGTDHTFTVSNSGGVPATGLGVTLAPPFSLKGGSFPGTGGTCTATVPEASSCTVVVTFSPASPGAASGTLGLSYSDGATATTASSALTGSGVNPALLVLSSAPLHDFGTLAIGAPADAILAVNNSGAWPATALAATGLAAPFSFKGGSYPGIGGTCGTVLNPGALCALVLTFTPSAAAVANGSIALGYFDGAATQSSPRALRGTGTLQAALAITDLPPEYYAFGLPPDGPSFDFGQRGTGTTVSHSFFVTNTGAAAASAISAVALGGSFSFAGGTFPGTGGDCASTLAIGATCMVVAAFAPATTGPSSATLTLNYNDGAGSRAASRPLAGTGVSTAVVVIHDYDILDTGPSFDFGTIGVGGSADHEFYVQNTGAVAATGLAASSMAAAFVYKGGAYPGTGGNCGASLSVGASCKLMVSFAPVAPGPASGTLSLAYNDGAAARTATRPVTGTGTSAALLAVREQSENGGGGLITDFGIHGLGSSTDRVFDVMNLGASAATACASTLAAPFAFKGGSYPGTGGTCGTTLAAQAACTVVVTFSPTTSGAAAAALVVSYHDGSSAQQASTGLAGTGTALAWLSIADWDQGGGSEPGPYDFGISGQPLDHTFYVSNAGAQSATLLGSGGGLGGGFAFKGGSYPGTGGTCAATLAVGAVCSVVVTFTPVGSGARSSALTLSFNDGATAKTVSRTLAGVATDRALLLISENSDGDNRGPYDYGASGLPKDSTFTVRNWGAVPATAMGAAAGLGSGFGYQGGSYPGGGGSCGATLAAGASCTVVVTFTPSGDGPRSATLAVGYNDGAATATARRDLVATATSFALLQVSESSCFGCGYSQNPFDFGVCGVPVDRTLWVLNYGAQTATALSGAGAWGAGFTFKGGSFPGTGGTCQTTLASGASCQVVVTFTPSGTGQISGTVTLGFHDGGATRTASRQVVGTATDKAVLTVTDEPWPQGGDMPFDFGTSGAPLDHTFYVSNRGAQAATGMASGGAMGSGFSFKGGSYPGTGGTCGVSLATGAQCSLVVTFTPSGDGLRSGTVSVSYVDGGATQTASRQVTGTATSRARLTLSECEDGCGGYGGGSPPPYDFGTTGVPVDRTFFATNSGAVSATALAGGGGLGSGFSFKGGSYPGTGGTCGATLGVGAACTVVVSFSPTGDGPRSATLTVSYHDGVATTSATRALTGTAFSRANLAIMDVFGSTSGPFDYGTSGIPVDNYFLVLNTGAEAANTMADGGGLAPRFTFKGGTYPGTGGTCGATLASGANCLLVVTFSPLAATTASGDLTVSYTDSAGPRSATRVVTGTGTEEALLKIMDCQGCPGSPLEFDFGASGLPVDRTFYLSNVGKVSATSMGDGATLAGDFGFKGGTFPGTGGSCGGTLASGESCSVVLTFTPAGSGARTGTFTVAYQDGAGPASAAAGLTGTAVATALLVFQDCEGCGGGSSSYDYGTRGTPQDHTFYLRNAGPLGATSLAAAGVLGGGFAFKGGSYPGTGGSCSTTLASGGSCTLVVTFTPSGDGLRTGSLTLDFHDGAAPASVAHALSGTATSRALLAIADCDGCPAGQGSSPYDFGPNGIPVDKTFYVSNDGAQSATAMTDGATLGDGFGYKGGTYPGTGGSCGATLSAGARCTVVVTFTPTGDAARSSTLTLGYHDGVATTSATRALRGTATTRALVSITDWEGAWANTSPFDFGTWGTTTEHTFYLSNNGAVAATAMAAAAGLADGFSFKGTGYPGTGGTCAASLPAGSTCTVVIAFAPSGSGPRSATLAVSFDDGAATKTASRALQGTATSSALLFISDCQGCGLGSGSSDFGTTGVPVTRTFWVTNVGGADATALSDGLTLSNGFAFDGAFPGNGGNCGTTIPSGAGCDLGIKFTPSGSGPRSSTLTLSYHDGSAATSATREVSATATDLAFLTLTECPGCDTSTEPFEFGIHGQAVSRTFYLRNSGALAATGLGGTFTGQFGFTGGSYPGTAGTCGASLASGATCQLDVTFSPGGTSGLRTGVLTLSFNGGAGPATLSHDLRGTATDRAYLTVTADGCGDQCGPYDFGTAAPNPASPPFAVLTLTNDGALAATSLSGPLVAPFRYQGGSYPGSFGDCGASLAAGSSCTVRVEFYPTIVGSFTGNATYSYSDAQGTQSASRALKGTAQ